MNTNKQLNISGISLNLDLEYYTDKKNIPNQKLVEETINYFKDGPGSREFDTLQFLNLLKKQKDFLSQNFMDGDKVITHLKKLPLSSVKKHILYGFILKWFGGYPINNLDDDYDKTLKLVQFEFLSYQGDTPEKEFCKVDQNMRNKFEKYGIALTTAINHKIDIEEVFTAMGLNEPAEKIYHSFDDLFSDAVKNKILGEFNNQKELILSKSLHQYEFNIWLQENKNWEYRNENQYQSLLTIDIFLEFITSKNNTKKYNDWLTRDSVEGKITQILTSLSVLDKDEELKLIKELIKEGENKLIEFKSTLRYCLNKESPQSYIEHSVLKTITAFLNSEGGTLFIGVDDAGTILGLDNDYSTFGKNKNGKDEWLKHFDNIFSNALGNAFTHNIQLKLISIEEKDIAIIKVNTSSKEAFMKTKPDNKKQFYIRRNASTIELDSEDMITYVRQKWG